DTFEEGDLGRDPTLHQRLESSQHDLGDRSPDHRMLIEQVGFAFLAEARGNEPGARAADRAAVSERKVARLAAAILRDGPQSVHALALLVERAERASGPLRRDEEHVEIVARLDHAEVDGEAVTEAKRGTGAQPRLDFAV